MRPAWLSIKIHMPHLYEPYSDALTLLLVLRRLCVECAVSVSACVGVLLAAGLVGVACVQVADDRLQTHLESFFGFSSTSVGWNHRSGARDKH